MRNPQQDNLLSLASIKNYHRHTIHREHLSDNLLNQIYWPISNLMHLVKNYKCHSDLVNTISYHNTAIGNKAVEIK